MKEQTMRKPLFIVSLIFICAFGTAAGVRAQEEVLCPQIANYTMDVTYTPSERLVTGTEVLTWTNPSEIAVEELWFHLYWNGFQNSRSTYYKESQRMARRSFGSDPADWGYCHVDAIRLEADAKYEATDLTAALRYRHPDDDNTEDQTVFSVALPEPLRAGETVSLTIDFTSLIPGRKAVGGVFGQWYPKIGAFYEDQWNCHQYHAGTEFVSDYGTYDVKITLPSDYVIGATGEHREKTPNAGGATTHRFVQHSVHNFAWTAGPHLLEFVEDYEFAPGKTTEITLLLQPQHRNLRDRFMEATKNAVKYCSLWFGDYPYTTVTCINPTKSRGGGMEYPTFFTSGAYFLDRENTARPESVIIHEFGHGYFMGLVGSNEFENIWMDEGFASFLDTEIYYEVYGTPVYFKNYFGIPLRFHQVKRPIEIDETTAISSHRATWNTDKMDNFGWRFMDGRGGSHSYAKGELMLRTLNRFLGDEVFFPMMKAYSTRWWFKHPRPHDFYAVVSEFAGEDMSWFLDQFVYGSDKLDYAVTAVRNRRPHPDRGIFDRELRTETLRPNGDPGYESEVLVRRLGGVRMPVEVRVVFEDGRTVHETWDGKYRWAKFIYRESSPVKEAVVDPEFKFVIDIDRTNNSFTVEPNKTAPLKWTSNWLLWLQHALEVTTLFGG